MNVQQRPNEGRLTPLPANELKPPSHGAPTRDAVNSIVDGLVSDICGKIADLRHTLDDVEQQILEGAAATKHALQDQVSLCAKVNDEISHMRKVVDEIKAATSPGK
jgi:predicted amino acid-binding ACT domain protein